MGNWLFLANIYTAIDGPFWPGVCRQPVHLEGRQAAPRHPAPLWGQPRQLLLPPLPPLPSWPGHGPWPESRRLVLILSPCELSPVNCVLAPFLPANPLLSAVNGFLSTCELSNVKKFCHICPCQLFPVNCVLSTLSCRTVNCLLSTISCLLSPC